MPPKKTTLEYFNIINPSEVRIKEEDIFHREKYKEIINYLKLILTESEDLEINNYMKLKGNLLINIHSGTDILDYLKLITSNFYINYIQLKESKILDNPTNFFDNFFEYLSKFDEILKSEEEIEESEDSESNNNKKELKKKKNVLVINQNEKFKDIYENESVLNKFVYFYKEKDNLEELLKKNFLLIWINQDYNEIIKSSDEIFDVFDSLIKIPSINKSERHQVLKHFMEKNKKITFDVDVITDLTENWEVKEINQLLKIAILKHHLNSELNTKSNEITEIIIKIIESGEFIPSYKKHLFNNHKDKKLQETKDLISIKLPGNGKNNTSKHDIKSFIDNIKSESYSDFMLNQLYENAASENYNNLVVIIDKLHKNEHLEEIDRKLLSKYPFILNDPPAKAQINLEKAKKKIDLIKKSFGK